MGLFDTIDRLNAAEQPESYLQPAEQPPATSTTDQRQNAIAEDSGPDTWIRSAAEIEERRRILRRKPERLSFLAPCPLCHGRAFLHIEGGGFACRTCQPGLFGHPVEAAGPDRPSPAQDVDLLPAGDHPYVIAAPLATVEPTAAQLAHFRAAWPWIKENRGRLLAAGWTMASLVRRARFRWPRGQWGAAWLPAWSKPGLVVAIGRRGEIVFTFPSGDRTINQAAHPPATRPRNEQKRA